MVCNIRFSLTGSHSNLSLISLSLRPAGKEDSARSKAATDKPKVQMNGKRRADTDAVTNGTPAKRSKSEKTTKVAKENGARAATESKSKSDNRNVQLFWTFGH